MNPAIQMEEMYRVSKAKNAGNAFDINLTHNIIAFEIIMRIYHNGLS